MAITCLLRGDCGVVRRYFKAMMEEAVDVCVSMVTTITKRVSAITCRLRGEEEGLIKGQTTGKGRNN